MLLKKMSFELDLICFENYFLVEIFQLEIITISTRKYFHLDINRHFSINKASTTRSMSI
jgi:hypothetical protein